MRFTFHHAPPLVQTSGYLKTAKMNDGKRAAM